MRITAGDYKGRRLETPKGADIRPTSDKVRQAVFNALHSRGAIIDAVVIDAFCGTGALGLEALSRGANFCIFIDKNKSSLELCRSNIHKLGAEDKCVTLLKDVTKAKEKPDNVLAATLVFLDPPYRQELVGEALRSLTSGGWLAPGCFFVIESAKEEKFMLEKLHILDEKNYGDTKITFAQFKD